MKTIRNDYYLLNPIFLVCLFTLLLNDHYLKNEFPGWLTGKLSDIAGIIILPLLIAFVFPKLRSHATWISAVLFIFWKSPLSQQLIEFYNRISVIQTSRIVDYTDLYVLVLLPLPQLLIDKIDVLDFLKIKRIHSSVVLLPTVIGLMATSPPPSIYYTRSNGNLMCRGCSFTVPYNQDEVIRKLREAKIVFDSITPLGAYALQRVPRLKDENVHIYRLNELIIDEDTLRNLDFAMRTTKGKKTHIYFNGMRVSETISDYSLYKKLSKHYRKILFTELKGVLD